MIIRVDESLCIGCGVCVEACGEVFGLNADGKAIVQSQHCDEHDLEEVADSCPVEAILVE